MSMRDLNERHFKLPIGVIAGRDLIENENDTLQIGVSYNFLTGIVADVISNPYEFLRRKYGDTDFLLKDVISGRIPFPDENEYKNLPAAGNFSNPSMIELMPANSIFAYIIDDNQSSDEPKMTVCYPFFPSHFSLPLKPGEYVWIISENIKGVKYYYWMCRKVSPRQIEDANYTNYERLNAINNILDESHKQGGNIVNADLAEAYSLDEKGALNPSASSLQGFTHNSSNFPISMADILKNSYAYNKEFTGEPVPRIAKGCGDVVIQGSNNAGIHITTEKFIDEESNNIDRSVFYRGPDSSPNENTQRKPQSAAVDIFVTRKRNSLDNLKSSPSPDILSESDDSKIKVVNNNSTNEYYNFVENNKFADTTKNDINIFDKELNDISEDATDIGARIYLSHQCNIDNIFGSNFDVLDSYYGPSIVTYAQHNRVIGASDVRLASRTGQSFIDLDPNGNIVAKSSIDNGQQFLSLRASGESLLHAKGKVRIQSYDKIELAVRTNEDSPSEPYILHSELAPILKKLGGDAAFLNKIIDILLEALSKVPPVAAALSPLLESVKGLREARDDNPAGSGTLTYKAPVLDENDEIVKDQFNTVTVPISLEIAGNNVNSENFTEFVGLVDTNIKSTKIFGE